jgi:hypothetical protein
MWNNRLKKKIIHTQGFQLIAQKKNVSFIFSAKVAVIECFIFVVFCLNCCITSGALKALLYLNFLTFFFLFDIHICKGKG